MDKSSKRFSIQNHLCGITAILAVTVFVIASTSDALSWFRANHGQSTTDQRVFNRDIPSRGGVANGGSRIAQVGGASAPELPVIATHTHLLPFAGRGRNQWNDWEGAATNGLAEMDQWGVRTAIIMPTPVMEDRSDESYLDELLRIARRYPGRFAVAGGGASLNGMIQGTPPDRVSPGLRRAFKERAEAIIRKGAVGFGELTALHFSFFKGHPYEETRPDHPLLLLLADIAAEHDVPIDLHVEAVTREWVVSQALHERSSKNPEQVAENISALERLLAHNRKARIIWVHLGTDTTGQRTVALTRRLLRGNPNLYLSITGNTAFTGKNWLVKPEVGLNPEWRDVFLQFPDRFMIGTDTFFQPDAPRRQMPHRAPVAIRLVKMPFLPFAVRRKIAFKNAQRVFRLSGPGPPQHPANPASRPRQSIAGKGQGLGAGRRFLGESEIRGLMVGNTLRFIAPKNGRELFIYLVGDGTAVIKPSGGHGPGVRKQWYVKDGGWFCRTVGKNNLNHCTRVSSTGTPGDALLFANRMVSYPVTVLPGRQLPQ